MDNSRLSRFTSSEIVKLIPSGKRSPFSIQGESYIIKKAQQYHIGKELDSTEKGKAVKWGLFVEHWLMHERPDILGLNYTLTPKSTLFHPKHADIWAGSPDGYNNTTDAVIDLKCPFTLTSYADFAICKNISQVRAKHTDGEKYYWQIVSNCAILGKTKGELIIYVPTITELEEIVHYAIHGDIDDQHLYTFINYALDGELPYITDKCKFGNKISFEFDIPASDFELLENKAKLAGDILTEMKIDNADCLEIIKNYKKR